MISRPYQRRTSKAVLVSITLLAACGGGGGGNGDGACPRDRLDDAWINKRLGCLQVGQRLIEGAASGASGAAADRAFVVRQTTLDRSFDNVLGKDVHRYFKHFLCVRQAPAGVSTTSLASDLAVAIGTSNASASKPPQVAAITLAIAGGPGPGIVETACNSATHPVVVAWDTRLIEAVSPAALPALEIFDAAN